MASSPVGPVRPVHSAIMIPVIDISLDVAPERRWEPIAPFAPEIRDLFGEYLQDLAPLKESLGMELNSIQALISDEAWRELEGLAGLLELPFEDVLLGNLYYDALKHLWGCTAFAVDAPGGPIHGRNLDWFSETGALRGATLQFRFLKDAVEVYRTIGWPGYLGCLSGIAPGRFAITLNTVASDDAAELSTPVSFLIRETLASAPNFDEAVRILAETPISSDCLLLVSGVAEGEMAVIERSPTRSAIRSPKEGLLVVTNDYRALEASIEPTAGGEIFDSSCGRFDRCSLLATEGRPKTPEEAIEILKDSAVRMQITVQHMAFRAANGTTLVELPAP